MLFHNSSLSIVQRHVPLSFWSCWPGQLCPHVRSEHAAFVAQVNIFRKNCPVFTALTTMWNQFELCTWKFSIFIFRINMAAHCPYMQSACKSVVLHICRWGGSLKEFVSQLLTSCDCRLIHFRLKTPTPGPGNIHPQHFRTSLLNYIYTYEIHWELPKWFDTKPSSSMSNDANEVFYTCIGVHCTPLFCLVMSSHSFSLHICSMCRWILGYRSHKIGVQSTQFSSTTYMSHPRTKIILPSLWSSCYFTNIQCWKQYSPPCIVTFFAWWQKWSQRALVEEFLISKNQ